MAISSPINIGNISKGFNSLKVGLGRVKASAQGIKSILFKKTKVKQQAITGKKVLQKRRKENILRKDQEDLLEASGIKPTFRRTRNAIVDNAKGFLGRILDFVGTLFIGWLLYNLPTIIAMTKDLIIRIQTLVGALTGFVGNIFNVFGDIGHILGGVLSDIVHLDFFDTDRKVRGAFDDLNTHFDNMGKQFEDGVNVFKTSLGEGKGEQKIPSTGTRAGGGAKFGEPQNITTGAPVGGNGGGRWQPLLDLISVGEGNYNSIAPGDTNPNLSNMTIGEANKAVGIRGGKGAIGRYQLINPIGYAARAGLKPTDKFSPENQDKIAVALIRGRGGDAWLSGRMSTEDFMQGLSQEWASLPNAYGKFAYSGQSGPVSASQIKKALAQVKGGGTTQSQVAFGQPNYSTTGGALTRKGIYNRNTYGYAGGQVQYITGDVSQKDNYEASHGTTSNYHDHLGFIDHATALKAFDFFKSKGFIVTEMKDRTSLGPSHQKSGDPHARGLAFDVPGSQWGGGGAIGSAEYQGSAKVRAALAQFLGTPDAQISSPGSTTNVGAITPERRGTTVAVIDNRQSQQQIPSGGGGGAAIPSIPSSDGLNSFIKQNLLLDLAYT